MVKVFGGSVFVLLEIAPELPRLSTCCCAHQARCSTSTKYRASVSEYLGLTQAFFGALGTGSILSVGQYVVLQHYTNFIRYLSTDSTRTLSSSNIVPEACPTNLKTAAWYRCTQISTDFLYHFPSPHYRCALRVIQKEYLTCPQELPKMLF